MLKKNASISFSIPLSNSESNNLPYLEEFFKNIATLHPEQTVGTYIRRALPKNNRLILYIPSLRCTVQFDLYGDGSGADLLYFIKYYNLCCSLQDCVFTHEIADGEKSKILKVTITPGSSSQALLKVADRYLHPNN